ncbi:MAG: hypothetical protein ACOX2Y_06005 [Christensenellales bacterium]|nr:hypothetical protein [Clostridiales bacterium]
MNYKKGGGFMDLGIYRVNFTISANKNGLEIKGLKKHKYTYRLVEDNIVRLEDKKAVAISKKLLGQLYVDEFSVVMRYGNTNSAYNTCMALNLMDLVAQTVRYLFYDKITNYRKVLIPEFDKDIFYLNLKISIKVNLLLIFSILFKIIIINTVQYIREIFYERN